MIIWINYGIIINKGPYKIQSTSEIVGIAKIHGGICELNNGIGEIRTRRVNKKCK